MADVETWLVAPSGVHHAHAACRHLTAEARAAKQTHPISRLARPGFTTQSAQAPTGFDICPTCTAEETVLEYVQRVAIRMHLASDVVVTGEALMEKRRRSREACAASRARKTAREAREREIQELSMQFALNLFAVSE